MLAANLFPRYPLKAIPAVNKAQMVETDRLMIEEYGISLERMMENAGRNLAILASKRFLKTVRRKQMCNRSGRYFRTSFFVHPAISELTFLF